MLTSLNARRLDGWFACFSAFAAGHVVSLASDADFKYPYEEKLGLTVKFYLLFNTAVTATGAANNTAYVLNRMALQGR
jgi:hypothetical protein